MNASKATRIAKAAGLSLGFDRELMVWAVTGQGVFKRFESQTFGKMTEAEFEQTCKAPVKAQTVN